MHHDNLWAPWRMQYIQQLDPATAPSPQGSRAGDPQADLPCFLCDAAGCAPNTDLARDLTVLTKNDSAVLLLNKYPYTNGHLLAAPLEHLGELGDLPASARADLMEITAVGERLLRTAIHAQGINIGMNLGRCAGAGLPGHLHVHIVPRWSGDTNFMQAIGGVRVIPQALEASYDCLLETLEKIKD